jgi:hypothetical protein
MGKKSYAAIVIAIAAVFAMPLAANAADQYVPDSQITVTDSTPAPGQPTTVNFTAGAFTGGEDVTGAVTGNGTASLSVVKAATVSLTKAASSAGAVSFVVTVPKGATGTYTLTATGVTSGMVGTAALTVTAADGSLAATGADFPFLMVWTAGGARLLGVALLLVLTVVRRQRAASAR